MRVPDHGTRACYQQGCRLPECLAAEARYRQQLRLQHAKGRIPLGTYISASEAWARIRVLKQERFTHRQITGWQDSRLPTLTASMRVRLATLLRLRRRCAEYLIPDTDLPNHQPYEGVPPCLPSIAVEDRELGEPKPKTAGYLHEGCGGLLEPDGLTGEWACGRCAARIDVGISAQSIRT